MIGILIYCAMVLVAIMGIWHFKVAIGLGILAAISLGIFFLMILVIILVSAVLSKFFHIPLKKQLRKCVVIPIVVLLGIQFVVSAACFGAASISFAKSAETDWEDDLLYKFFLGDENNKKSEKSDSDSTLPQKSTEI